MDDKIFLGKYRVSGKEIEAVGETANGPLAYEAYQIDSGQKVVVELIPAGSLKTAEREQLEAEANAAKKLKHANIPVLYDFGIEDDHLVYVTEDFEGTLAEEWVNAHGPLAVGPVLRIASQVVSALGAASLYQISHRAINPSNLVLVSGQTNEFEWPLVKVLHFVGAAPKVSDTGGPVAAFDKSLHYASPEQIQKGTVDFRSEIYSLGCTMWFLLTGVPPLVAPKEPAALAATTARGKVRAIPRKVRRLLSQMISSNPDLRPHDPLEFYRKLQDCLVQVERREAVSPFGLSALTRNSADMPTSRRLPMKTFALAALLLIVATLAAIIVPGYLRHRRVVKAEEPIGVPVGVPSSVSSPPNTVITSTTPANATSPIASNSTQTTNTLAQANSVQSAPAQSTEPNNTNTKPPPTNPAEGSNQNQVAIQPAQPSNADSSQNPPVQQPAIAENTTTAATGSSDASSANRAEISPVQKSPYPVAQQTPRKKFALHEVRRAEPAEPEVRRAEPAPPAEGGETSPETTAPSTAEAQARARSGETEQQAITKPRTKSKRYAQQRWRDETIYAPEATDEFDQSLPRTPRRTVRARFVGVTPDGMWIMRLPSNKIIVVPPPRRSYEEDR